MTMWNDYFYGPVAAIRPYLFQKFLLLVVATDALVLMTERGCRYGIDGFNVAHFRWLDALQPLPTATWYVGVLMLVSLLALVICFLGPSRLLLATLAILYTYAWAMSRHDSYLHHYMLSLILSCMVFFPRITYTDLLTIYLPQENSVAAVHSRNAARPQGRGAGGPGEAGGSAPRGTWFVATVLGSGLIYRTTDGLAASWLAFCAFFLLASGLAIVFLRQTRITRGPLTVAWGYRLLGATVGIIYIYTSAAKADAQWCAGHTLKHLGSTTKVLAPLVQIAKWVGISSDSFWALLATLVIPLELTISASYFVAVLQDEPGRKWIPRWCIVAWILAIGLHLNNELMNLSIQWFGYYMMFLATLFLLPERVLLALGACVVLPAHWWSTQVLRPLSSGTRYGPWQTSAATALAVVILFATSRFISLPGALWSLPVAAAAVVLYAVCKEILLERTAGAPPLHVATAAAIAGCVMFGVIFQSDARHDYYWGLGTELQHLTGHGVQTQAAALAAYEQAEAFGPPTRERNVELLINMGLAHSRLNNFAAATERYEEARRLAPENAHVRFNMGVNYQVAGDLERAAECFRQAIERNENYAVAHRELGRTLEQRGDLSAALASLRAAQRLVPNDLAIQQDVARMIRKMRDAGIAEASGTTSGAKNTTFGSSE